MNNILKSRTKNLYNLQYVSKFSRPIVKSTYHGTESISYLGPKIWGVQLEILKNIQNLQHFEKEIKTWKYGNSSCNILCRIFILLSKLCILFCSNIIYENFSKTQNILSLLLLYQKFFIQYIFLTSLSRFFNCSFQNYIYATFPLVDHAKESQKFSMELFRVPWNWTFYSFFFSFNSRK